MILSGKLCVVYVDTGEVTAELVYHQAPVSQMSFSDDGFFVITSSKSDAAMWDLRTNSRVMVLNIQPECGLKLVSSFLFVEAKVLNYKTSNI